jgi:hypothetical protein
MYITCIYQFILNAKYILRQGHDSAPGLDIMLLKQQFLTVSLQAANPARQHPPVQYIYRSSHPLLQFLPQKLAEWIGNNYAEELNVLPRPDPSKPCSTATLNQILQSCIVSDSRGINIHTFQTVDFESDLYPIFFVYTCTELMIMLTAGLFGNYPSLSILHRRS